MQSHLLGSLAWLLLTVRVILGGCLCGYLAYASISVWAAIQWRRAKSPPPADWTPGVTILKPVRGIDAEAWENFVSFCRQDYPAERVQILFGALDSDDPALDMARRLQAEFPNHDIGVISAPPEAPRGNNRKVSNLLAMLPYARHDLLVLCDSDMRVRPDYLRRVVAPFAGNAVEPPASLEAQRHRVIRDEVEENEPPASLEEQRHRGIRRADGRKVGSDRPIQNPKSKTQNRLVGLVTCPYRGAQAQSFAAAIEALSIGADFIPSTLVSRAIEGISFALGSTIAIPRAVLDEIGGFEPLLDELADDFRLGNGAHKAGYEVVMSDYVIESVLGRERFSAMWSRRLRWSRTLKVCRPAGYAGVFLTYGFALALLFVIATGFSALGWTAFTLVCAFRIATALFITLRCTGDPAALKFLPLLPVGDVLGLALYVASFFGSHIVWRGERFRLLSGGRLVR